MKPGADFLANPLAWPAAEVLPDPPPQLRPGGVLAGRYRILSMAGRGGMGDVYAAMDLALGEKVALKLLRPEIAARPAMLARFKREIKAARRISHPYVCRVHDWVTHAAPNAPPIHFVTMEWLEGETLAGVLSGAGRSSADRARRWLGQIASGLDAIHAAGIAHGDLTAANVILLRRRAIQCPVHELEAVIIDFGLARCAVADPPDGDLLGDNLHPLGTFAYLPPERLAGGPATIAADVYAFGVLAREVLAAAGGASPTDQVAISRCLVARAERRPRCASAAMAWMTDGARQMAQRRSRRRWACAATLTLASCLVFHHPARANRRLNAPPAPKPSAHHAGLAAGVVRMKAGTAKLCGPPAVSPSP